MAKACASHGSRNSGPCSSRGMPGTTSMARRNVAGSTVISGGLQVRLEGLDRDRERRVGVRPPEVAAVENYSVEPLRVLAPARRDGVREDVAAAHCLDHPSTAARVARQAGVARRVYVLRVHPVARLEPGRLAGRAAEGPPCERVTDIALGHDPLDGLARSKGVTGGELIGIDQPPLQGVALHSQRPSLI